MTVQQSNPVVAKYEEHKRTAEPISQSIQGGACQLELVSSPLVQQQQSPYVSPERASPERAGACQQQPPQQQQPQQQPQQQQPVRIGQTRTPSQMQLYPTPPKTEAAASYEDQRVSLESMIRQLITCTACNTVFNRGVICSLFQIQLNRPIQCTCGCVMCTICYRDQRGCKIHNMVSTRGAVNTTANVLASRPELDSVGQWALEFDTSDPFKAHTDVYVQTIMRGDKGPEEHELQNGRCTMCMRDTL